MKIVLVLTIMWSGSNNLQKYKEYYPGFDSYDECYYYAMDEFEG